jgi:hypothetical protein
MANENQCHLELLATVADPRLGVPVSLAPWVWDGFLG